MADLQNTTIDTTGFLQVPVGPVADRPGQAGGAYAGVTPQTGMIRLCTDFPGYTAPVLEYYDGTDWKSLYTPVLTGQGGSTVTTGGYTIHTYSSTGSDTFEVIQS